MKLAACISITLAISGLPSALAAAEQCRFIEARSDREACYQRQETERAARQKAKEAQEAAQPKPYEPMAVGGCPARKIHARHLPGLLGPILPRSPTARSAASSTTRGG